MTRSNPDRCSNCDCNTLVFAGAFIAACIGVICLFVFSLLVVVEDSRLQGWDSCTCYPPLAGVKFEGTDSIAMRWTGMWTFVCPQDSGNGTVVNQYPAVGNLWRLVTQTRSKIQSNLASISALQSIDCHVNPERTESWTNRINIVGWGFALAISIILIVGGGIFLYTVIRS